MKDCKRVRVPSTAVGRLSLGNHPDTNAKLATGPRPLIRRDVGTDVWFGHADPFQFANDCKDSSVANANAVVLDCNNLDTVDCGGPTLPPVPMHVTMYSCMDEGDPFGHGTCVG